MRYSKKTMKIRMDYNNMMSSVLGKERLRDKHLSDLSADLTKAFDSVEPGKGKGVDGWAKKIILKRLK